MSEFFPNIPHIKYEGRDSKNRLAFKYYDPQRVILGKTMEEHLTFAMAWWHNLCAVGVDMFGAGTADKTFGAQPGTMSHAKAKVDAGIEFMQKLGIKYYCFHDADIVPEDPTDINETNRRLDELTDYLLEKTKGTGIRCLWATANMFSNARFMNGAGSSNSADVFCFAAAQAKKGIELAVKLGARGYVFWGGREGYETLLNTDMALEQDNVAQLFRMSRDYGRSIGFKGDFYIEPKPKEPMKHQYDFDAATAIGFLQKHGLDGDFKMNIEANHATLAGHTFQHELRVCAVNGMMGSVDANQGDMLLGWDTDQFPSNVYDTTLAMYEILKAGGLRGGLNFDAKNRRPSNTPEDMFTAFIIGMDSFALGLIKAAALIEDGRIDAFVKERYASYETGIGAKIKSGTATLEECAAHAAALKAPADPGSGGQEYLEGVVNNILFGTAC